MQSISIDRVDYRTRVFVFDELIPDLPILHKDNSNDSTDALVAMMLGEPINIDFPVDNISFKTEDGLSYRINIDPKSTFSAIKCDKIQANNQLIGKKTIFDFLYVVDWNDTGNVKTVTISELYKPDIDPEVYKEHMSFIDQRKEVRNQKKIEDELKKKSKKDFFDEQRNKASETYISLIPDLKINEIFDS